MNRNRHITLRVTQEEYRDILAQCQSENPELSLSEYVREKLLWTEMGRIPHTSHTGPKR